MAHMTRRQILGAAAALPLIGALGRRRTHHVAAPAVPLYPVNYYPVSPGGYGMWEQYSGTQVRADMAVIKDFGFNAMRAFLDGVSGAFDFPSPTSAQLANLQDFYAAAQENGLALHLTLFDLFGGKWGKIAAAYTWATAVIGALQAADPALSQVFLIEAKNEALSSADYGKPYTNGFDSGWPAGVPQSAYVWNESGGAALVWLQYVTYKLRALAPGVPLTVSMPTGQYQPADGTHNGHDGLGVYCGFSYGTDWQPDWYDYHCYGAPSSIRSQLATAQAVASPAPLRIGECGVNFDGSGALTQAQQQQQASYVQNVRYYCAQLGIGEPCPWILYDIAPGAYQFPGGQMDGLKDTSGNDKLLGAMYRSYPPGVIPPLAGLA